MAEFKSKYPEGSLQWTIELAQHTGLVDLVIKGIDCPCCSMPSMFASVSVLDKAVLTHLQCILCNFNGTGHCEVSWEVKVLPKNTQYPILEDIVRRVLRTADAEKFNHISENMHEKLRLKAIEVKKLMKEKQNGAN